MSSYPGAVYVPPVPVDKEDVWNTFLSELMPYQLHRVMLNELQLHDDYVSGDRTLMDIFASVAEDDDDPPQLFHELT